MARNIDELQINTVTWDGTHFVISIAARFGVVESGQFSIRSTMKFVIQAPSGDDSVALPMGDPYQEDPVEALGEAAPGQLVEIEPVRLAWDPQGYQGVVRPEIFCEVVNPGGQVALRATDHTAEIIMT